MARAPAWQRKAARCKRGHRLQPCAPGSDGWACDARLEPGGCASGITGYWQTEGHTLRFECRICDYDLCRGCFERVAELEQPRDDGFRLPEQELLDGVVREQDVLALAAGACTLPPHGELSRGDPSGEAGSTAAKRALLRPKGADEPPGKRRRDGEGQHDAPVRGGADGAGPDASAGGGARAVSSTAPPPGEDAPRPAAAGAAAPGAPLRAVGGVPIVDPAGEGGLIEALSGCGAAFVRAAALAEGSRLPDVAFSDWHELWLEAVTRPGLFRNRAALRTKTLKFSTGEDLARTLHGSAKVHTPDVRYNFGTGCALLGAPAEAWGELHWIQEAFWLQFQWAQALVWRELAPLSAEEPPGTLGAKVRDRREGWTGTNLRHSVYPAGGSCTEHTDYGVVTVQQSTAGGLEGFIHGEWHPLQPPEGCALVFAGDMLERLTSGRVRALRHRVCLAPPAAGGARGGAHGAPAARQAHILFLQPDRGTVVQPLRRYARGDGTDPPPIKYGDWHRMKSKLAFKWD